MRSVSVIGIGETKMGSFPDRTVRQMVREAGDKAMADAKVTPAQIEALYFSNFNGQYLCGQGHMGPLVSEELGLGHSPTIRVEGACASGSLALRQAYIAVASGLYDVVLVGGVEKMTHQPTAVVTTALASASEMQAEAGVGLTFPSIFALIASRYFHEYGNVREAMTYVAMQNHENAVLNPDAQMPKAVTREKVEAGIKIADPLNIFDCSLVTDGSAFVVVAATNVAKKMPGVRPIEIIGSGHAGDVISLAAKASMTEFAATKLAAAQAYAMAGITAQQVDLAEVHDCFTITQIINCEDLGFFPKGHAAQAILEGKTARVGGVVAINPSGGLKAKGHPIGATGLSQVFELVTQLRGEAGARQVPNAKIGLNHNLGGSAGTCVVNIFREVQV